MAAASSNPWNETPARRPGAADFGAGSSGFILADEDEDTNGNDISPIKDGTQPYAAMFNRVLEGVTAAAATLNVSRRTANRMLADARAELGVNSNAAAARRWVSARTEPDA